MNKYELTLVIDGKSTPAKQDSLKTKLSNIINVIKGKIIKTDDWGKKELSYKIGKLDTGVYIFFELELENVAAKSLATKLKMEPEIIRYLLIRKES